MLIKKIVVCTNDYYLGGNGSGIRVYGDANNSWVPTRRIWNQHAYHITNINEDGSVPAVEQNSWQVHNSYRLNAQPGISPTAVADLTASYIRIADFGGYMPSTITARIGNGGSRPAPAGVSVAFYNGEPGNGGILLGTVATPRELGSGEYVDLNLTIPGSLSGIASLWVVADDDGTGVGRVTECDELNNRLSVIPENMAVNLSTYVSTNQTSYASNTDVAITDFAWNFGSFGQSVSVQFTIKSAADGAVVATLPPQPVNLSALPTIVSTTDVWNTGSAYAGNYVVEAALLDAQGHKLTQSQASFSILGDAIQATARISTDKPSYQANDQVHLSDRIRNATNNVQLTGLAADTQITTPAGEVLWSRLDPLGSFAPGAVRDLNYSVKLNNAAAGTYHAILKVLDSQGLEITWSELDFAVASSAATGSGLTGELTVTPSESYVGEALNLNYSLNNHGNADLPGLPVTVRVVDPAAEQVLFSRTDSVTVNRLVPYLANASWQAQGAPGQTYVAVLSAEFPGETQVLDQQNLSILQPAPPLPLQVTDLVLDCSGFAVRFNHQFNQSVINLYSSGMAPMGPSDVLVVGETVGSVQGSLLFDADGKGLRFLTVGSVLAADNYMVTLRSGANALTSSSGDLDGNADGVGGDDYVASFTVAPAAQVKISLPDFMRGPGQNVDVPAANLSGLPVSFESAGDVRDVSFEITHDTALLTIAGASAGADLPVGAQLQVDVTQPGLVAVTVVSNDVLPAGRLKLVNLHATVPTDAPYQASQRLDIHTVRINGDLVECADDDALHVVGYLGDTNASLAYESTDVTLIQRMALRLDTGFAAWDDISPLIVADVDDNKVITTTDATRVNQELHGYDRPEIPPIPTP